jgi:hypothetical protein
MKDDRIYLLHVRDAIRLIVSYTAAGKESFFSDQKTQDGFLPDFMFQLTSQEFHHLKSQFVISSWGGLWRVFEAIRELMTEPAPKSRRIGFKT